jgi:4-carboxymuconolactone decarboxylase
MNRLDKLQPESLDVEQRALYESIVTGPRSRGRQVFALTDEAGCLEGPFNAMLQSPRLGAALQGLGAAVRYESSLSARLREIVILVVAHHWHSEFEIYAHEAVGSASGLDPAELDLLRAGRFDELTDPVERQAARTAYALVERADLDDTEFAAALEQLQPTVLFEVLTIVGYYATLALQLRVYRVSAP